jgi:RNA 3'-terminal phosphate cyclase (ATP)
LLEIDGSYGEGGGQILRNAVALSTLLKKPVRVTKIRANRPNPGIKAQHYVAIKSIAELCDAEVSGLEIGSSEIEFKPGDIKGGRYKFDIGTAGSITLAFQACILACANAKDPVTISLTGGTDVKWSPSWDYFEHVYLLLLKKMGVLVFPKLILRGYYPKGGGQAVITIKPSNKIKPLKLKEENEFTNVSGKINISNLPDHIITRMRHATIKTFLKNNIMTSIDVDQTTSLSPGVGITLWTQTKDAILGNTMLGEKGVSSEEIGHNAANNLLKEIESEVNIDIYAFDQILPYMVIAKKQGESSCKIRELSSHASTNMWLLQRFFDVNFEALQNEKNFNIKVS